MKIALVSHRFHPRIGGVELHVKEIAERFAHNNEVRVFTLEEDKSLPERETFSNGVIVMRFHPLRMSEAIRIPPRSMVNEIKSFNPDIIHVHNIHSLMPYFASKANVNAKLFFTPHYIGGSLTRFRRILFNLYRPSIIKVMKKATNIVCISEVEKRMLLADFTIESKKMVIIPNGVDAELSRIIPKRGEPRILSVGRLDLVHKKTDKLIMAFKLIEHKFDGKLVLVGDGPDKSRIVDLVQKLSLSNRVELKSNLTRSQLFDEYSMASMFVMASENETYGIVVAEALTAGLRVVIPNTSGLALFVNAGYAAGINPPITPEKIAESIMNNFQNMNNATYQKFIPYTWDMVSSNLQDLYSRPPSTGGT